MASDNNIEDKITEVSPEQIDLDVRRVMVRKHIEVPDIDGEWQKLQSRIHQEDSLGDDAVTDNEPSLEPESSRNASFSTEPKVVKMESKKSSDYWKMAACFLGGVAATVLFVLLFNLNGNEKPVCEVFTANTDSKEILLSSDAEGLKVVDPKKTLSFVDMKPAAKEEILTLSTPRGQDYSFTLPDGTKVWLNADSKIEFPMQFAGPERVVTLHGEAYFEVTKDSKHAFIVKSEYLTTKVYGTSFNMRAYTKNDASVALISGSVAVRENESGHESKINPGQMAKVSERGDNLDVAEVDTYPLVQWKDGFFYFDNNSILDIMLEIGRWYNVSIVFEDEDAINMNTHLHFVANRTDNLETVIESINELGTVHVSLDDNTLTIR